jgi:hypothetical protein
VPGVVVAVAASALLWRLARRGGAQLASMLSQNRSTKAELLHEWAAVQQRLQIMTALVSTPSSAAAVSHY